MKILILSNLYPPHVLGGYEILCGQVCEEYAQAGHEVVVLTSRHGVKPGLPGQVQDPEPAGETVAGIRVERLLELFVPFDRKVAGANRQVRSQVGRLNRRITQSFLRTWKPDVVHVWSQLRLTLGPAQACHQAGLPMLFSFNDEHISGYRPAALGWSPRSWIAWFLERTVYRDISLNSLPILHATAISDVTRRNIRKHGIQPEDFAVIYQGIPVQSFPSKHDVGHLSTPLRLLYVGQLHQYKGVHTVVEAAHLVAEDHRVTLTIAGAGDPSYENELRHLATAGQAEVRFLGRVGRDQISTLYRNHDVLVFSSIWEEPFGLTHLEAMASGLPVISTLCGGQGEFLNPDQNCLAFAPEDSEGLADQIVMFLRDPSLARRIALSGQEDARVRFSVSRYATELLEKLRALCP